MERSIELILDMRPSPDLVEETLNELGAIVEEAMTETKLHEVTKERPEIRVAQKEPGAIVYWIIVAITFTLVTAPVAVSNTRKFIRYCTERFGKQKIPLHKFEVKLDGNPIMKLEAPADQLLHLNAQDISKSLERFLKQANESCGHSQNTS